MPRKRREAAPTQEEREKSQREFAVVFRAVAESSMRKHKEESIDGTPPDTDQPGE